MMTDKTARVLLLPLVLTIVVIARRSRCSLLPADSTEHLSKDTRNEFLPLEESRYLAELQGFRDVAIEIDLIEGKKHLPAHQEPRVLYQIGDSEEELPICSDRREVCSKVDLYGAPWLERQCRCPGGRICPGTLHADDGHTIVDKTRQYKLCEPVKRLPVCQYFKDVTWTLAPGGGSANATVQRVHCRCRPGSVPYLSRLRCQHKEPCRLFTVRKRRSSQLEEVNASPLCQCPTGHRCPRRHTDPGSLPARSYSGALEVKTYSGYCVPFRRVEPVYAV